MTTLANTVRWKVNFKISVFIGNPGNGGSKPNVLSVPKITTQFLRNVKSNTSLYVNISCYLSYLMFIKTE